MNISNQLTRAWTSVNNVFLSFFFSRDYLWELLDGESIGWDLFATNFFQTNKTLLSFSHTYTIFFLLSNFHWCIYVIISRIKSIVRSLTKRLARHSELINLVLTLQAFHLIYRLKLTEAYHLSYWLAFAHGSTHIDRLEITPLLVPRLL